MALDKTFGVGELLTASDANAYMRSMWVPVDKQVIASGSPVSTLTFSSLDSSLRIFRLTVDCMPSAGEFRIRLNNDSGTNYNFQGMFADASTAFASRSTSQTYANLSVGSGARLSGQVIISKALSTLTGTVISHTLHASATAAPWVTAYASTWNNTGSLINRIDLLVSSGTFYGVVGLEGMRGA